MLRLSPPGFQRFVQARSFDVIYGGGKANVAASLVNYELPVEYATRLPANDIGDACLNFLRQYGIGTCNIARGGDRTGVGSISPSRMPFSTCWLCWGSSWCASQVDRTATADLWGARWASRSWMSLTCGWGSWRSG
jgi:sugar/nucleoside kinase (ribokinase family)